MEILNHNLTKLMYYLEYVFTVIQSVTEIIYTNYYLNYNSVLKQEEQKILNLVSTFNYIKILISKKKI